MFPERNGLNLKSISYADFFKKVGFQMCDLLKVNNKLLNVVFGWVAIQVYSAQSLWSYLSLTGEFVRRNMLVLIRF